jgi:hypothetical protein
MKPKKIYSGYYRGSGAKAGSTHKCSKLALVDERAGADRDSEIVEPVGRASNGDTLGAHAKWENLADDDPSNWQEC